MSGSKEFGFSVQVSEDSGQKTEANRGARNTLSDFCFTSLPRFIADT